MNSYIETQNPKSYPIETNEEDSYIPHQVETLLSVK